MTDLLRDATTAAALARLYDVDLQEDPGDLDLYLALAARTGGPVLELAAGTGRIAIALAQAGHEVTAVDIDPAMLARLRARLEALGPNEREVAARVRAVEADLAGLKLPGQPCFGLVFVALNSLLQLGSRTAQRAAFVTMARHLARDGVAVVDVWLPAAHELARYDGRSGLEYVRIDPETGLMVAKTASASHDPAHGTVELTAVYEEGGQGQPARRWVRRDVLKLLGADELREMALAAGLEIEIVAGSYDLEPLADHDDRVILVTHRGSRPAPASLL
jgi:SAM-dependent methyltransferase